MRFQPVIQQLEMIRTITHERYGSSDKTAQAADWPVSIVRL